MSLALAAACGWAVTVGLVRGGRQVLGHPTLGRENYRGVVVPTAGGIFTVAAVVLLAGGRAAWAIVDRTALPAGWIAVVAATATFGFLGVVDDLLGDGGDRGIRGHVGALRHGRITTGLVKLTAGAAISLAIAVALEGAEGQAVADGALIALAANLANLLDRAPGRCAKWSLLAGVPVAVAAPAGVDTALGVVVGATAALLAGDLRERFMLGDTGANAIGAATGVAAVAAFGPGTRQVVAAGLLLLTLLSERVSLGRLIRAVPPLRWFDDAGRRRDQGSSSGTSRSAPGPTP